MEASIRVLKSMVNVYTENGFLECFECSIEKEYEREDCSTDLDEFNESEQQDINLFKYNFARLCCALP